MNCPSCGSDNVSKIGSNEHAGVKYDGVGCDECGNEWGDIGL